MIDLTLTNIALIVWTLGCLIVWTWLKAASDADDEQEKMGTIRRIK